MSSQRLVTATVFTIAIRYTVQRRGPGNTWHHVSQKRRDDRLAGLRRTSINGFPCKALGARSIRSWSAFGTWIAFIKTVIAFAVHYLGATKKIKGAQRQTSPRAC